MALLVKPAPTFDTLREEILIMEDWDIELALTREQWSYEAACLRILAETNPSAVPPR